MSNPTTNPWQRVEREPEPMPGDPSAGAQMQAQAQLQSNAALLQRPALTEIERKLAAEEEGRRAATGIGQPAAADPSMPAQWPLGPLPTALDPSQAPSAPALSPLPARRPGVLQRWRSKGGLLGGIASALIAILKLFGPVIALLSKLKFLVVAGKLLLTGGSMALSMWAYSTYYGWAFGVGLVGLIFIHECGHALAARMRGMKTGIMLFIPMMGAFVTTKGFGRSLTQDAFIGIMGPVVGTAASAVCGLLYFPTHNLYWLLLASWGFLINLFNLLPMPPLDGGWITPLFSPKLLAVGAVIAVAVGFLNPLIWFLALPSLPRIIGGWKADPQTQPYYHVATVDKWRYGAAYVGLAAFLGAGWWVLHGLILHARAVVM